MLVQVHTCCQAERWELLLSLQGQECIGYKMPVIVQNVVDVINQSFSSCSSGLVNLIFFIICAGRKFVVFHSHNMTSPLY